MNKDTYTTRNDTGTLAAEARALMAATADVAGDKVNAARKRLAVALECGKEIGGRVREKAVEGAKAADAAMREHPYQAIGIALGVGASAIWSPAGAFATATDHSLETPSTTNTDRRWPTRSV